MMIMIILMLVVVVVVVVVWVKGVSLAIKDRKKDLMKIALFMNVITAARNWPQEKIWKFISEFILVNVHSLVIYVASSFRLHQELSVIWEKFMKVWKSMCVTFVAVPLQTNGRWRTTVVFIQGKDLLFVICVVRLSRQRHLCMFTIRVTQIFFPSSAPIVRDVSELRRHWHCIFCNILERNLMLVRRVGSGFGSSMSLESINWFIQMGNLLYVFDVDIHLGWRSTSEIITTITIKMLKKLSIKLDICLVNKSYFWEFGLWGLALWCCYPEDGDIWFSWNTGNHLLHVNTQNHNRKSVTCCMLFCLFSLYK